MKKFLEVQRDGAILTLTMNEPHTRNALTGNTASDEFVEQCDAITRDKSVRAVIVTGANSVFSSGGNVKDMQKYYIERPSAEVVRDEYRYGIQRIPKALYHLDVPTIAAVSGPAVGAGLDLACMCDIRIAARSATFAESFVKVGIVPGDGGAWFLPRLIGSSRAAQMMFTGDPIDSNEALDYGLVSDVVADDELMDAAMRIAGRIVKNPGGILRMTKQLIREGEKSSLESLLEISASYQAIAHQSLDHEEAVRAFIQKRPPIFNR